MLLNHLDQTAIATSPLNQSWSRVIVQQGDIIVMQDQSSPDCYKVITGCVRLVRELSDGRRLIGRFVLPGDLIGFELEEESYYAAEAVTKAILIRYPRRTIEDLAASHLSIAKQLYDHARRRLREACSHMTTIGRQTSVERVASLLLEMWERRPTPVTHFADLPMSRSDMADYLCLTTETVSRELMEFCRRGLIEYRSKHKVIIRDQAALVDLASETRASARMPDSDVASTDSTGAPDRAMPPWPFRGLGKTTRFSGIGRGLAS